jgi:hypothetical protein
MNRKHVSMLLAAALAAGFGGAALFHLFSGEPARAATAQTVVASQLIVVDGSGRPRGSLAVKKGAVVLTMRDGQGVARLALAVTDKGAVEVGLLDKRHKPRLVLTGRPGRFYGLVLRDNRAKPRVALGLAGSREASLMIFDPEGRRIFAAPYAPPPKAPGKKGKKR